MSGLENGAIIKMMIKLSDLTDTLVVTEKNGIEDDQTTKRAKPIIWFNSGKWRTIPREVISKYKLHGYYLVAVPWDIRSPVMIGNKRVERGQCHVLQCVRNEPILKYNGKVGPITSFVPRVDEKGVHLKGNYIGIRSNGEDCIKEIPDRFRLRDRDQSKDNLKRLAVFVGKDGYCVGMEVKLTKAEESERRQMGEYHHTRPIVLQKGFYLFEGYLVFQWEEIQRNPKEPINLNKNFANPLISLGIGIHLITSTKQSGGGTNVQISPVLQIIASLESPNVIVTDLDQFSSDFNFD